MTAPDVRLEQCHVNSTTLKCYSNRNIELEFCLIDTPGFEDAHRTDAQVLNEVTKLLYSSIKLSGIIYLSRIGHSQNENGARRNLAMLQNLCDKDFFSNSVLMTTAWNMPRDDIALKATDWVHSRSALGGYQTENAEAGVFSAMAEEYNMHRMVAWVCAAGKRPDSWNRHPPPAKMSPDDDDEDGQYGFRQARHSLLADEIGIAPREIEHKILDRHDEAAAETVHRWFAEEVGTVSRSTFDLTEEQTDSKSSVEPLTIAIWRAAILRTCKQNAGFQKPVSCSGSMGQTLGRGQLGSGHAFRGLGSSSCSKEHVGVLTHRRTRQPPASEP